MTELLKWIAAIIGYLGVIFAVFVKMSKILKAVQTEKDGILCLLRSNIRKIYYAHCDEDDPTLREYERKDLDELYNGYHTLHGNTFIDDLYEKMRHWKVVT